MATYIFLTCAKEQVQSTFFSVSTVVLVGTKTADDGLKRTRKKFSFTRKDQQQSANARCCWIQNCCSARGECKIYIKNAVNLQNYVTHSRILRKCSVISWLYLCKGEIDTYPPPRQELQCALLPSFSGVYNLWKCSKSDMKFYVNGISTSVPDSSRKNWPLQLKRQYLNKCRDKTQNASSSHHTIFALRQTNQS